MSLHTISLIIGPRCDERHQKTRFEFRPVLHSTIYTVFGQHMSWSDRIIDFARAVSLLVVSGLVASIFRSTSLSLTISLFLISFFVLNYVTDRIVKRRNTRKESSRDDASAWDVLNKMRKARGDVPMKEILAWYTELVDIIEGHRVSEDLYKAIVDARDGLKSILREGYAKEGKLAQFEEADANWVKVCKDFVPVGDLKAEADPHDFLRRLTTDPGVIRTVREYQGFGANPNLIRAARVLLLGAEMMRPGWGDFAAGCFL